MQAAAGCLESFEELVRRFQVPLLHFISRRTRVIEDAEDVTQEAFVRAYRNIHRYQPQWRFSTWLFTIARRLSISQTARKRVAVIDDGLENSVDKCPQPWQRLEAAESRDRLWDIASENLDENKFTAVWLYYVEQMPVAEIAKVLGRSRASVQTMLFRARQKIRTALTAEADTFWQAVPAPPARAESKFVWAGGSGM